MLEDLAIESFQPHVGTRFLVEAPDGGGVDLELEEVLATGARTMGQREQPFALIFRGPEVTPLLQGIHQLKHDALGTLGIFIVPIGPGPDAQPRYEAIFN